MRAKQLILKKVGEQETNKSAKRQPDKARAVQESCRAKYFTGPQGAQCKSTNILKN